MDLEGGGCRLYMKFDWSNKNIGWEPGTNIAFDALLASL
jgi:hypothetical protein